MTIHFDGPVQLAVGVGVNYVRADKFSDTYLCISLEKDSYSILK